MTILTAILNPEGIAGAMRHSINDAKAKRAARNVPPSAEAAATPQPEPSTAGV